MCIFRLSTVTIDSVSCDELNLRTEREGEIQTAKVFVTISSHWSTQPLRSKSQSLKRGIGNTPYLALSLRENCS